MSMFSVVTPPPLSSMPSRTMVVNPVSPYVTR